jgi:hypothetical protein
MRWLAVFALFLLAGCQTEQTYVSFKPGTTAPDRQKAFRRCKATADEAMAAATREDLYERDQAILRCLELEGYRAIQRPTCKTQSDRSKAYYQPQPDAPVQMKCSSGIAMELPATVSTPPRLATDCSRQWRVFAQWAPPRHPCRLRQANNADP